jgi:hypothetical protein
MALLLITVMVIVYSHSNTAVADHGDVLFDFYVACLAACPTTGHQKLVAKINRKELFDFMLVCMPHCCCFYVFTFGLFQL